MVKEEMQMEVPCFQKLEWRLEENLFHRHITQPRIYTLHNGCSDS